MNKKAQNELMGFAMVILLLTVGILFFVSFVVLGDNGNDRSPIDKRLVTNMHDALLETTTECGRAAFREVLADCLGFGRLTCFFEGVPVTDSCVYAEKLTAVLFNKTFDLWNVEYDYRVIIDQTVTTSRNNITLKQGCRSKKRTPSILQFRTLNGDIISTLRICNDS
ncbi:MAG: hypothetical protein ACI8Y7_000167 [Candidatus Woesearchaeota archaeon]|jgi:hypothetical protein